MMTRCRRGITLGLLLLNVSGARAISVQDPCRSSRDFYGPSLAFRGVVAKVMHQDFRKNAASQRSLGERRRRWSTHELELTGGKSALSEVVILPPSAVGVQPKLSPAADSFARKLPTDLDPTSSPHLHAKK